MGGRSRMEIKWIMLYKYHLSSICNILENDERFDIMTSHNYTSFSLVCQDISWGHTWTTDPEKTWNGNFDHKSRTMQSHTFIIDIYMHPAISYYFTQIADTNTVERYMHDKCMRLYGNLSHKSSCRFQLWNVYVYMWAHLHTCLFASSKNTLFSLVTGSNRSGLGQSCT